MESSRRDLRPTKLSIVVPLLFITFSVSDSICQAQVIYQRRGTRVIVPSVRVQRYVRPAHTPSQTYVPRSSVVYPQASGVTRTQAAVVATPAAKTAPAAKTLAASNRGGKIGVRIRHVGNGRVIVTHMDPGSPAQRSGLRLGDQIQLADGRQITDTSMLIQSVKAHAPGESMKLRIVRDNKPYIATVTVGGAPKVVAAKPPISSNADAKTSKQTESAAKQDAGKGETHRQKRGSDGSKAFAKKPSAQPKSSSTTAQPKSASRSKSEDQPKLAQSEPASSKKVEARKPAIDAAMSIKAPTTDALEFGDEEPADSYLLEPKLEAKPDAKMAADLRNAEQAELEREREEAKAKAAAERAAREEAARREAARKEAARVEAAKAKAAAEAAAKAKAARINTLKTQIQKLSRELAELEQQ